MTSQPKQQQHSDYLIDTSVYDIDFLTHVYIGLDSRDLFWPKIVFSNGSNQITVTIQFLQRLYAIYPYISSLSQKLNKVVILQDEQTTVRILQAYSTKLYLIFEAQSFVEHKTESVYLIREKSIWMTIDMTKRLYELKNKIFDSIYRKLIVTRPRIVREIKMILKHVVNNIDDDETIYKLTIPKTKPSNCMIYFHDIITTEYIEKCLDFASRIIFVKKNTPRIKVIIY